MPDLRPATAFRRKMTALERRYIRSVEQAMRQSRLALVEALVSSGGNDISLVPVIRRELDDLRRQVAAIAAEFSQPIEAAAATLAERQFEQVARLTTAAPDFQAAQNGTAGERRTVMGGLLQNITNWIDALQVRLQTELGRLRASGEETDAIVARLLAEDVADGRVSVWRDATNRMASDSQIDLWTAATNLARTYYSAGENQVQQVWRKQAIAAIDERTTDCCLRVHGQIQDRDKPFKLTGTPRFRDEIMEPPFHWFCRTATALWLEEFEQAGITTEAMRAAALAELEARERTGTTVEIHPAHATSRR